MTATKPARHCEGCEAVDSGVAGLMTCPGLPSEQAEPVDVAAWLEGECLWERNGKTCRLAINAGEVLWCRPCRLAAKWRKEHPDVPSV